MSPIGGPPNGILVAPNKFVNHCNVNRDWSFRYLFGATKIPFGGPPIGDTQNLRENNFFKNGLSCHGV